MEPAVFAVFASHNKPPPKHTCCVKPCQSLKIMNGKIDGRLSYHSFPKANTFFIKKKNEKGEIESIDRLEAWKIALGVDTVSVNSKICSLHFTKDDYYFPDVQCKRRHLKRDAVPCLFVPNDCFKSWRVRYSQSETQKKDQGNINFFKNVHVPEEIEFVSVKTEPNDEMIVDEDVDFLNIKNNHSPETSQKYSFKDRDNLKTFQDAAVQVNSAFLSPKILDFIESDSDLETVTGIESFEALESILKSVLKECGDKYERVASDIKTAHRVIMACAKIKNNLSFSLLAIMFRSSYKKISHSSCQQICNDMIETLYSCYKKASKDEFTALTLKRLELEKYRESSRDK